MIKTRCSTGKSHGKIILMGEHAVVHGEPSIALPFPAVEMTATVCEAEGPLTIDCSYYNGIAAEMPEILESMRTAIQSALTELQVSDENLRDLAREHHPGRKRHGFQRCRFGGLDPRPFRLLR